MRRYLIFLIFPLGLLLLWGFIPQNVVAQEATLTASLTDDNRPSPIPEAQAGIYEPANGSTIAGMINITGTANSAWALYFSYVENTVETWFPLAQSSDPVLDETLSTWNTSGVTDGVYLLRLSVFAAEGKQDFVVKVRISNNSPIMTATLPVTMTITPTITTTITPTISPTKISTVESTITLTTTITATASATPISSLPPVSSPREPLMFLKNPATLEPREILVYLGEGILTVFMVFVIVGLIFYLRHK